MDAGSVKVNYLSLNVAQYSNAFVIGRWGAVFGKQLYMHIRHVDNVFVPVANSYNDL
jgi:hypothetical protein